MTTRGEKGRGGQGMGVEWRREGYMWHYKRKGFSSWDAVAEGAIPKPTDGCGEPHGPGADPGAPALEGGAAASPGPPIPVVRSWFMEGLGAC